MKQTTLERALERTTGETIENLRSRTLEETRDIAEKKHGFFARIISHFPFIGRRDSPLVSHEEVERRLLDALAGMD
jgi:hypothetical protein